MVDVVVYIWIAVVAYAVVSTIYSEVFFIGQCPKKPNDMLASFY